MAPGRLSLVATEVQFCVSSPRAAPIIIDHVPLFKAEFSQAN